MIVRVWGHADEHELEFTHVVGDEWEANVPPDFTDGQYIVELYALNDIGQQAMWMGILYMNNGKCSIVLHGERFTAWLLPPRFTLALR